MSASDTRGDAAPVEIDAKTAKWADLCAKLSLVVIALGAVVGAIIWVAVDGALGEDLGALTWVAGGSGAIALISIRQALLAERI